MLDEDTVEDVVVSGLRAEHRVLEKGERGDVGEPERSEEVVAAVEKHLGVANGETTSDRLFTVETVSCLGCCSLAPAVMVDKATHGNLSPSTAVKTIKKYQKGERS